MDQEPATDLCLHSAPRVRAQFVSGQFTIQADLCICCAVALRQASAFLIAAVPEDEDAGPATSPAR